MSSAVHEQEPRCGAFVRSHAFAEETRCPDGLNSSNSDSLMSKLDILQRVQSSGADTVAPPLILVFIRKDALLFILLLPSVILQCPPGRRLLERGPLSSVF